MKIAEENKKDHPFEMVFVFIVLWRLPTLPGLIQVSSAVLGLTSLFGMGRGEHQANSHQQVLCWFIVVWEEVKSIATPAIPIATNKLFELSNID